MESSAEGERISDQMHQGRLRQIKNYHSQRIADIKEDRQAEKEKEIFCSDKSLCKRRREKTVWRLQQGSTGQSPLTKAKREESNRLLIDL